MTGARGARLLAMAGLLLWAGAASARVPQVGDAHQTPPKVRPVYTLLVGQPRAPALPPLSAVSSDVAMMHAFFGALLPEHNYVHLPAGDVRSDLAAARTSVGPPTWPAIEASVDAIAAAVRASGEPADIYIYYAGHGRKRRVGAHTHTDLFLHATAPGGGEGFDGILSTRLLQQDVLEPLQSDDTRVHLIVDACQSAYLLESRGMRRTQRVFKAPPTVEPAMLARFTGRYAGVGALLATSGSQVTYESASSGGLFSYAVRTAGIGLGDIDADGRVTYGELSQVLPQILSRRAGGALPTLLAPGAEGDVPFLDYRGRATASVTFEPRLSTRYELKSTFYEPFAAIFATTAAPTRVYLPEGAPFLAAARVDGKGPRTWSRFRGASDLFDALSRPLEQPRAARSASDPVEPAPLVLPRPLTAETLVPVEQPEWVWVPERYTTLSVGGLTEANLLGRTVHSPQSLSAGLALAGAYGDGPDQLSWRLSYAYRSSAEHFAPNAYYDDEALTRRRGHLARLDLGYSRVLAELALVELSAGGFGGGGLMLEKRGHTAEVLANSGVFELPVAEVGGELTARVLLPDSVWAVRADLRVSGQWVFDEHEPYGDLMLGATIGLEYEFVLR